jgi:hypothetical protein
MVIVTNADRVATPVRDPDDSLRASKPDAEVDEHSDGAAAPCDVPAEPVRQSAVANARKSTSAATVALAAGACPSGPMNATASQAARSKAAPRLGTLAGSHPDTAPAAARDVPAWEPAQGDRDGQRASSSS